MINSIKGAPVLAVLMLIMGITVALPVDAAKLPTGVELDVYEDDDDDD